MPFCSQCGAQLEGAFCARCGARAASPAAGEPAPASGTPGVASSALPDNAASALCYILGIVTGILFLALEPYNRNREVRFHAWQSVLFSLGAMALYVVEVVLAFIMPWFLMAILSMVAFLVSIGLLAVWLILMYKAYHGERWVLPIIGPIAASKA